MPRVRPEHLRPIAGQSAAACVRERMHGARRVARGAEPTVSAWMGEGRRTKSWPGGVEDGATWGRDREEAEAAAAAGEGREER
jgi:hypothetical protein